MTLGEQIRRRRKELGLSQHEAGELAGMNNRQWSHLETGHVDDPHLSTLRRVAAALGWTVPQLLLGVTEPK